MTEVWMLGFELVKLARAGKLQDPLHAAILMSKELAKASPLQKPQGYMAPEPPR